jgi:hypothetical protein
MTQAGWLNRGIERQCEMNERKQEMAELPVSESRPASSGKTAVGRLFVLELNAGRIHSMNPDGFDKKTIVTDCRNCDGIVVDVKAGHIYWTNMGIRI